MAGKIYNSIKFTAGTTTNCTSFVADGDSTNKIVITSVTSATHTLSDSGGTNTVTNCTISYSIATGGATWNSLTSGGNTDGGNNTGWVFSIGETVEGVFAFLGTLGRFAQYARGASGGLWASGTVAFRQVFTKKSLAGLLSLISSLSIKCIYHRSLDGIAQYTGVLTFVRVVTGLAGNLALSAALSWAMAGRVFSGLLAMAGQLVRKAFYHRTIESGTISQSVFEDTDENIWEDWENHTWDKAVGGLTWAGVLTLGLAFAVVNGALSFAGTLTRAARYSRTLAGNLWVSGSLAVRQILSHLSLSGAIQFAGDLAYSLGGMTRAVAGSFWMSGALALRRVLSHLSLAGNLWATGALTFRQVMTRKALSGASYLTGAVSWAFGTASRILGGSVSFAGSVAFRQVRTIKTLAGSLRAAGDFFLGATLDMVGNLSLSGLLAWVKTESGAGVCRMNGSLETNKLNEILYYGVANP